MKNKPTDPFQALSTTDLAQVNGGRLIPNKGPDASIVQGIQMLVQTIAQVGQQMAAGSQGQSQYMMQMMQQMMERRRGGG
jgi:hypothetical protein